MDPQRTNFIKAFPLSLQNKGEADAASAVVSSPTKAPGAAIPHPWLHSISFPIIAGMAD